MTATVENTQAHAGKTGVGRVARVIGPVVDVEFGVDDLPEIYNALTVDVDFGTASDDSVEGESKLIGFDIVASEGTRNAVPDFAWLEAGSVQLKGKSRRLPIHILVGDAELARSEDFMALRAAHAAWLSGSGDLARCVARAGIVDKRLGHFYELVPARADDFASPA